MQTYMAALLIGVLAGNAYADELSYANRLLESKNYSEALRLYDKLSATGNPEAQFHLGEMYWYGEGVGADEARAKALFEKAAGGGSKGATEALTVMQQRVAHKADIAFYTEKYDGADVALSKFNCGRPVIPELSKNSKDISAVAQSVKDWQACYNGFVASLNAALPPGKAIPPAIADLMNGPEYEMAKARMDKAYATVAAEAKATSDQILAENDAWYDNTVAYVKVTNARIAFDKAVDDKERQDIERGPRFYGGSLMGSSGTPHK